MQEKKLQTKKNPDDLKPLGNLFVQMKKQGLTGTKLAVLAFIKQETQQAACCVVRLRSVTRSFKQQNSTFSRNNTLNSGYHCNRQQITTLHTTLFDNL